MTAAQFEQALLEKFERLLGRPPLAVPELEAGIEELGLGPEEEILVDEQWSAFAAVAPGHRR